MAFNFGKDGLLLCWGQYSLTPYINSFMYITVEYELIEKYLTEIGKVLIKNIMEE